MLTSTPEFKAVLRMLHDSGREVTPDELLAFLSERFTPDCWTTVCQAVVDRRMTTWWVLIEVVDRRAESE